MAVTKEEIEDLKRFWFAGPKDWRLILRGSIFFIVLAVLVEIFIPKFPSILIAMLIIIAIMVYLTQHGLSNRIPERTINNSNITLVFLISVLGIIISLFDNSFSTRLIFQTLFGSYIWGKFSTWVGVKIWNWRGKPVQSRLKMENKDISHAHKSASHPIFWQFIQELVGGTALAFALVLSIFTILIPTTASTNPIGELFSFLSVGLSGVVILPSTTTFFEQRFGFRLNKWMKVILFILLWTLAVTISEVFPNAS